MVRDHGLHPPRFFPPQVDDRLCRLHLYPCAGKLKAARACAGLKPADNRAHPIWHAPQGQPAGGALDIGDETLDRRSAFAEASRLRQANLVAQQIQQGLAALVPDD
jgi:hypothetical protein